LRNYGSCSLRYLVMFFSLYMHYMISLLILYLWFPVYYLRIREWTNYHQSPPVIKKIEKCHSLVFKARVSFYLFSILSTS
jgi:hypothetical protein